MIVNKDFTWRITPLSNWLGLILTIARLRSPAPDVSPPIPTDSLRGALPLVEQTKCQSEPESRRGRGWWGWRIPIRIGKKNALWWSNSHCEGYTLCWESPVRISPTTRYGLSLQKLGMDKTWVDGPVSGGHQSINRSWTLPIISGYISHDIKERFYKKMMGI